VPQASAERFAGGATVADATGSVREGVGEIRELLEVNSGLEARTVFEYLQRRYSGQIEEGQLRNLQRRVKSWRATEGPAKEVLFA
jgi:hypothetical protein